ncbi:hypothetical protein WISP_133548 [Willisornis vidua]|uniref:Reverse transcriptase n=1 Tax=Willisornis vidua TaxID=1566151 RepID=A0ABQ9CV45_9PASS|nr:hypothetical protein WISP_133548 [Willisornis vidua]
MENTKLASEKRWGGVPKFEERSTNAIPQPASHVVGYNVPLLKCFYTNACIMRNKQGELRALAQSQRFDITSISETWWIESCDWNALLDGYRLFKRDRQDRGGGRVALCVLESLGCTELTAGKGAVECIWVEDGHLTDRDREKAEVFNAFFASAFNVDDEQRGSQCPELEDHERMINSQMTLNRICCSSCIPTNLQSLMGFLPESRKGCGVLQDFILSLIFFNIFISDLDTSLKGILIKFADDTNLGGAVNSLEGREAL